VTASRADDPAATSPHAAPLDAFGRRIEYLRVSLTDRCNYRCVYCMPAAGLPLAPPSRPADDDEIVEVVRQLSAMGLRRVRLTGGEPTLRPTLVGSSRGCAPSVRSTTSRCRRTACGSPRSPRRSRPPGSTA
jgi:hypothetical protein